MFLLTESKAWIRSAFTVDNGFPVIRMVKVSSFSEAIKLPNQDFLVISGEDSGVGLYTGSISTVDMKTKTSNNNVTSIIFRGENKTFYLYINITITTFFSVRPFFVILLFHDFSSIFF